MEAPLDPDNRQLAGPRAVLCSSCNTWINGPDAWVTHITGKAHRRRAVPRPETYFSSHEQFWARQAARQFLATLLTRHWAHQRRNAQQDRTRPAGP
eukprot:8455015-Lingulodinium_polyedra.AAC.1